MKVIFNLSPLGASVKTGIYRVAEHLVCGMAEVLDQNAIFHPVDYPHGSVSYFREKLSHTKATLIIPRIGLWLVPLSNILNSFIIGTKKNRSFAYRLARRSAWIISEYINFLLSRIDPSLIEQAQIYHSPFRTIPSQIRRNPKICRFTTIYDLIPITNPNYFEKETINLINNLICQLDESDYTLCISGATRETLLKHSRCRPDRSFVVPLAASKHFHPTLDKEDNSRILAKYGIISPNYLLSLCTLEIRKNLETVVHAFKELHDSKQIPIETQLVLVGEKGWYSTNLEAALAASSKYQDKIIMTGFIPEEDLAAIYSNAKVFVYMSFLEGFGLPPLEAMQCGIPVITSNTSSLPEVVGDAGIMLEPTDVVGICSAVTRMFEEPTFHAFLSKKSLDRSKYFSWDRFISDTIKYYNFALQQKNCSEPDFTTATINRDQK